MFANKNLFDDEGEVDIDAPQNAEYQNARPMTAASTTAPSTSNSSSSPLYSSAPTFDRAPSGNFASSLQSPSNGGSGLSDLPATPTPAMRKAKMEEMRRAHLDKRKQKAMAAPTVMRANADQLKSSPSATSTTISHTNGGATNPMIRQPTGLSDNGPSSSTSSGAFSPTGTRGGAGDNSDDENEGTATGVDDSGMGGGHLSSLLAEKRAEKERKNISRAEREMMEQGIAPVFDPVKPMVPGVKLDFSDMRSFLLQPVPKGTVFQCYILRNKKGLKNKLYPTYEAYISGEERFLLAAKKRTKNKTSNYMISMDKNNVGGKESASYLGKVRSNFVGTEFVGYDKGINPKDLDEESASISMMSVRQELCAVFYESNILGSKGPRKMTAVVPNVKKDGHKTSWKPLKPEDSILVRYKSQPNNPEFLSLVNKTPKWNDQVGAYVLNFNGRVTQASVKNFQLINTDDPETVLLQFGRIGKDTFTMDLQYPLSPIQAFSICLTSFDYKFACE